MTEINATIAASTPTGKVDAELSIKDQPLRVSVNVPHEPIGLSEIVPLARQLADEIVRRTVANIRREGKSISCRKRCTACCSYLVPLSVPELFRLRAELPVMSARLGPSVASRFETAIERIMESDPPDVPSPLMEPDGTETPAAEAAGRWYAQLRLECPLLAGGACMIHSHRPIVCREHIVTSSPKWCSGFQPGRGQIAAMPVCISHSLTKLTAETEGTPAESVMLPLAPLWIESNRDRTERTWAGRILIERFLEIVQEQAA